MDTLQTYLSVILKERGWSWTIIGIVYLSSGLFVRSIMLRPVVFASKQLNRSLYHDVKKRYFRKSAVGWFFFLIPLAVFALIWSRPQLFPITIRDLLIAFGGVVSYLLSVIFHLQAFGIAGLFTLKQTYDRESAIGP